MSKPHRFAGRRVAVVMGGLSAEREVSLDTGAGVLAALLEHGWDAVAIDWAPGTSLPRLLEASGAAVVWNALHGTWGEDGAVQGLCACMQIACTGSGILASALAMDKVMSKRIFESNGLPTPRWRTLPHEPGAGDVDALAGWPLPCVVKPANEGSSVGVSIVDAPDQLGDALALARSHHGPVIIEEYIAGTEVFVGILNDRVLGSVEVRPAVRFYNYEAKYKRSDTRYLIPPELPAPVVKRTEEVALAAYRALGCTGHARPDLRISTAGEPFILEVNTLPGLTKTSLLPKIARSIGMDYPTLCDHILETATTI
ncbi:MAG: D-alanine--D-alanine ligase [Deltaproteobacteria bacterium]|nr:MAG: D-alanine--D-alanine ligase [Deltaproteobacteria bacterium]TMQ13066.1 MAG: D-alanine--D-alanine ligase [Deltaproteobacteria bacterium]